MANNADRTKQEIYDLVDQMNLTTRDQVFQALAEMDPIEFESLMKFMLEVMGYKNVKVTSPTNDKGVDLIAEIEVGIFLAREVFQVKRQQAKVGRAVLDALRGSFHRFDAVRATIMTTGGFSTGAIEAAFEFKVIPVSLVDGYCLLNILLDNEIGARHRQITYMVFDANITGIGKGHFKVPKPRKQARRW